MVDTLRPHALAQEGFFLMFLPSGKVLITAVYSKSLNLYW